MKTTADRFLPVELIFNPNWWHHAAGISFEEPFYLDPEVRIANDVTMRRILHERYGEIGLGDADPQPRAVIGSPHVAGGFVIPAILGSEIEFAPDAAPQPRPMHLSPEQLERFEIRDFRTCYPMQQILAQMDELEARFGKGSLVGDLNTDGLLNAVYHLYGQQLFADFYESPERAVRLMEQVGDLIVEVALAVRERSSSTSISVNSMVGHLPGSVFLHSNCSVQMISPASYRKMQFPIEKRMAERLEPFGVHHCGNNMHRFAADYARLGVCFCDVGWGSDVSLCRQALPDAFLNLRLNPVRMLQCTPEEIAADTERLLSEAGPLEQAGVCCINMDQGTPDDNIFAMFEVVERYRRMGA